MRTLIAALVFIFSVDAAHATKIVGNGGDSVRLDIVASQQYLAGACDQIETLRVLNVSCFDLRRMIQLVGQNNERLHIEDDVDLGDGIQKFRFALRMKNSETGRLDVLAARIVR